MEFDGNVISKKRQQHSRRPSDGFRQLWHILNHHCHASTAGDILCGCNIFGDLLKCSSRVYGAAHDLVG